MHLFVTSILYCNVWLFLSLSVSRSLSQDIELLEMNAHFLIFFSCRHCGIRREVFKFAHILIDKTDMYNEAYMQHYYNVDAAAACIIRPRPYPQRILIADSLISVGKYHSLSLFVEFLLFIYFR